MTCVTGNEADFKLQLFVHNRTPQPEEDRIMTRLERVFIGAIGGLSAVLVKFLGQDYATIIENFSNLTADQILCYKFAYIILTPILMFLGAVVAWVSDERKRIKLFALAIAAPALVTTWSGGHKGDAVSGAAFQWAWPSTAYADKTMDQLKKDSPDAASEKTTMDMIKGGVGVFFGYGKAPERYWVIVGSFKKQDDARKFADEINRSDKNLGAWIGLKIPPNDFYPVIVGEYSYLGEARKIKKRALQNPLIKEAYLSKGSKQ